MPISRALIKELRFELSACNWELQLKNEIKEFESEINRHSVSFTL